MQNIMEIFQLVKQISFALKIDNLREESLRPSEKNILALFENYAPSEKLQNLFLCAESHLGWVFYIFTFC